jgi:hypothetical protein
MQRAFSKKTVSEKSRQILLSEGSTISGKIMHFLASVDDDPEDTDDDSALGILAMEAETILIVASELVGKQLSPYAGSKLLLGVMALTTDMVNQNIQGFINFANTCSSKDPIEPDVFDPNNVSECACAVVEYAFLQYAMTDEVERLQFSDEICRWIGGLLLSEGFLEPFPPLLMAKMPDSDRDVESAALADVVIDTDTTGRAQVLAQASMHLEQIFEELNGIVDEHGRPVMSGEDYNKLVKALGLA